MAHSEFDQRMHSAPYTTIWNLAWPQIVMMFFHFLIGFVDVWVAGRIGRETQALMGVMSQAMFFFMVVAIALANGSVAAISQSSGAGLPRRIKRFVGLGVGLGMVTGLLILAFGLWFDDHFLRLLQIPAEIMPIAEYLLQVSLYIMPAYYLFTVSNAFFRAQKIVTLPLYSMILVTGVNTLLDLGLGLGMWGLPNLGYKGIAWATFASILCGTIFNFVMMFRCGLLSRQSLAPWRWVRLALPYLIRVAWPAGVTQLVWHSAYMVLYAITASLPFGNVVAMAGMSAGIRIEALLFLPGIAFNFTASILVGHYLGQGQKEEAKRIGYKIMLVGVAVMTVITGLLWLVIEPVIAFVAPDVEVQEEAIRYLAWNMAATPPLLAAMILGGAFTGAGATIYQAVIFGSAAWLVRLPLAYMLGHVVLQSASGVWMAMFASVLVQCGTALYYYQYKDWYKFTLRKDRRPA
ncbi:MAG: MATE family efflux transporter [Desulfomicrobium sp.]|nr:MATE family efflux transporter [Pseudomonadota bacterium]MBV1711286.1 MATE family efflux transporter [Desulfomicrobium sp.]MBU4569957.1 MATE family efflux transporter [Pseudomonadota bacterium]MBU4595056.1 MATE family efflux transporter [Pseudomonadota bacterium]MBV1720643.1 MATE family efflux transporter [Desulfomicrobium sp.]